MLGATAFLSSLISLKNTGFQSQGTNLQQSYFKRSCTKTVLEVSKGRSERPVEETSLNELIRRDNSQNIQE